MIHQVGIDTPLIGEDGLSDPVNLFDEDGILHIAQWCEKHKCWFEVVDGEIQTYGNKGLLWWSEIQLPHGWVYDSEFYSLDYPHPPTAELEDNIKALEMMGFRKPKTEREFIDIDSVMADIKKTIEEFPTSVTKKGAI